MPELRKMMPYAKGVVVGLGAIGTGEAVAYLLLHATEGVDLPSFYQALQSAPTWVKAEVAGLGLAVLAGSAYVGNKVFRP